MILSGKDRALISARDRDMNECAMAVHCHRDNVRAGAVALRRRGELSAAICLMPCVMSGSRQRIVWGRTSRSTMFMRTACTSGLCGATISSSSYCLNLRCIMGGIRDRIARIDAYF